MLHFGAMKPNVLFITLDQWRGDCLSALGHPAVRTPNIDALAAEGVLFRRHYAQASPCGPSRASLLTGLYLHNHRSVRNGIPLDRRHTNVALEARKAGYEPLLFGYTDTSLDPRDRDPRDPALANYEGILPGFSVGLHLPEDHWAWLDWLKTRGHALPPAPRDVWLPPRPRPALDRQPARYGAEESESAFLTDRTIPAVSRPPFFLHVTYFRPHNPFIAPTPWNEAVDPASVPAPARRRSLRDEGAAHPWLRQHLERAYRGAAPVQDKLPLAEIGDEGLRLLRATYYGLLGHVDAEVGRLFDALRRSGRWDDTLVVLTSDHGEQLGDHWMWGKDGWFDGTYHVPLIVKPPGVARGRVVDAFTESVDLLPTILDAIGREPPPQLDGRSLMPFLAEETPPNWRQEAYWEYDFRDLGAPAAEAALGLPPEACTLAVQRGARWKYVHFAALPPLLYDLERDPHELEDRAADPACREVLLDCARRMLSWRLRSADRTLTHIMLGPGGPRSRGASARQR
jgi:arylsulfatase A-like enzyme